MGNWIPGDPTLVAQILKISSAYSPPPTEGFISPMTWGLESHVTERFAQAGVSKEDVSFVRDTYIFSHPFAPSALVDEFRQYYGPTDERLRGRGEGRPGRRTSQRLPTPYSKARTRAKKKAKPASPRRSCA